jgi:uncharacterized protein YjbI with pentapeptide repeats
MANQEQLNLLKQGVEVWNQWRKKRPDIRPDLSRANLEGADLRGANLLAVDLEGADLRRANLRGADLDNVDLSDAVLIDADLSGAKLLRTHLIRADLSGAELLEAEFNGARLTKADLSRAWLFLTIFGNIDLSEVKGLETVDHAAPSTIGIDTIYRSQGRIPEAFLRGAGVPDAFITYARSLIAHPIEFYTVFISYSSHNQAFAKRLYTDLQSSGVRCWFAPEDLKIGDKIRPRIDESIRLYDKLLLVLSQHSVTSQWVEQEVETALEKERKEQRTVLFPIRLDETVMEIEGGWPALIRNTRTIGDFTRWKRHDAYQKALDRLLRDLKAEASKLEAAGP